MNLSDLHKSYNIHVKKACGIMNFFFRRFTSKFEMSGGYFSAQKLYPIILAAVITLFSCHHSLKNLEILVFKCWSA